MNGTVPAISYAIGAGMFALLILLMLTAWRGRLLGGLLLAACLLTMVWAVVLSLYAYSGHVPWTSVAVLEVARDAAWLFFLRGILVRSSGPNAEHPGGAGTAIVLALVVSFGVLVTLASFVQGFAIGLQPDTIATLRLLCFLAFAVVGLAFVEQLFRSSAREYRWQIKFLCIGLGGQFVYDFFLYAHGLLFGQLDIGLWTARGLVQALVVPFLALTAVRNPEWSVQIFVSRHVVFQSMAVLGGGVYLLAMAGVGYYIRVLGGTWGRTAQIAFFCGAIALLVVMLSSKQARSRAKVFVTKHFFRNKYDYRVTWLAFTQVLSGSESPEALQENIVRGVAGLMESPGGVIWTVDPTGAFRRSAHWGQPLEVLNTLPATDSMVAFLRSSQWVIYVNECQSDPAEYDGLTLASWLCDGAASAIVPLFHRSELLGFIALVPPLADRRYDWEDTDLLKTLGRQAGSYLAHLRLTEALADAKQFEAFNRLSSYVVHDLKNLVAQLSLVVKNSERHLDNPEFVRDAIGTVANASGRMRKLLDQLRKGRLEETSTRLVNVGRIVRKVIEERSAEEPAPTLGRIDDGLVVSADAERLQNILGHIVQNAQDATSATGDVTVSAYHEPGGVRIEVCDTGAGMDAEFVAQRLFKPFETTKGNAGMGIGVYETREFVNLWGGTVDVDSVPGRG
ncbi:MAG: putative PEP-CTERM system histidine kinase, partial [Gammaproteobacteria bacterium]